MSLTRTEGPGSHRHGCRKLGRLDRHGIARLSPATQEVRHKRVSGDAYPHQYTETHQLIRIRDLLRQNEQRELLR